MRSAIWLGIRKSTTLPERENFPRPSTTKDSWSLTSAPQPTETVLESCTWTARFLSPAHGFLQLPQYLTTNSSRVFTQSLIFSRSELPSSWRLDRLQGRAQARLRPVARRTAHVHHALGCPTDPPCDQK